MDEPIELPKRDAMVCKTCGRVCPQHDCYIRGDDGPWHKMCLPPSGAIPLMHGHGEWHERHTLLSATWRGLPSNMTWYFAGEPVITIHADGRVEVDRSREPDHVARTFWEAVERTAPAFFDEIAERWATKNGYVRP